MVNKMTAKDYLVIENNIVTNRVVYDNASNWTAPEGSTLLIQEDTEALIWKPIFINEVITDFELSAELGMADIGFTWDGTFCKTNHPKPVIPVL